MVFSWEPALWLLNSQGRVLLLLLSKKNHCNFQLETMTFEPRHENKTCSACREWLNERLKESESGIVRESESEKVWGCLLSIEMKTKVVQDVKSDWMRDWMSVRVRKSEREWECDLVPSFCLTFRHFFDSLSSTLSPDIRVHRAGSQLKMSESQTKAGNQSKFEKNWKFEKIWKFENLKFKIAQVDPRDMLNNFCFHVWAEKSLFIAENCNAFFWPPHHPIHWH